MNNGKGIVPNGEKIKELRKKSGKTQKGLLKGSPIQLRTYQRAEQGLPVLPEMLQQIAELFAVLPEDLRQDRSQPTPDEDVFRLHCLSTVGANKLVDFLQDGNNSVDYTFEINPPADLAEQVAAFIEFCQRIEITRSKRDAERLSAADKIRAIGQLNDMLARLRDNKICTYAGAYRTWAVETNEYPIWDYTDEHPTEIGTDYATVPLPATVLKVVFTHENTEYTTETYPAHFNKQSAFQRAIAKNLELGIRPEWLKEHVWWLPEFIEEYREAYDTKRKEAGVAAFSRDSN